MSEILLPVKMVYLSQLGAGLHYKVSMGDGQCSEITKPENFSAIKIGLREIAKQDKHFLLGK